MAAFSSNIDITSGGTYGMDVTNGESSLKVANDLNGKMANIQQYLQNGLPEVWTGDSLPDSLPDGKILIHNNRLYMNNEQISPYCGTIIRRSNSGIVDITFPTCNYIYICVLCVNYSNDNIECDINILLDLNQNIEHLSLNSYAGTNFDHIDYGNVNINSYSNTNVSLGCRFNEWRINSYQYSYNYNVYYVCFS